ncbi:MAG: FliM/FliN family flagellar motor switch protein, partial [Pseudomonadota bacterium]
MDDQTPSNALQRLASAGQAHHQARSISLQKGMRLALGRVADAVLGLPMAMLGAVVQEVEADGLGAIFNDEALLMLLDGPAGARGAAMFDATLVGGIIQQQTLGEVRQDDGSTRRMTRTDAAMCAPLIDRLLEVVAPTLEVAEERSLIDGFRFGSRAADTRGLLLALEATGFAVLRLTIDMAQGARQGEVVLVFPRPDADAAGLPDDAAEDGGAARGPELADAVMTVPTTLNMVVCDIPMSLDAVHGLRPGDVLSVPPRHFPEVRMTTVTGRIVGKGIVGHVDGVRAVKPQRKPNYAAHPMRRESDAQDL